MDDKKRSLEERKFKAKILNAINKPMNPEMDESECREWMCILPEAKRYVSKKMKVCNHRIAELDTELEIIEAEIGDRIRATNSGTATERGKIIESAYRRDPRYAQKYAEIFKYQELVAGYEADIENLTEKSFAVRKIADFERTHLMYEDD